MAGFSRFQSFFLLFLVASMSIIQISMVDGRNNLQPSECPGECARRCSATSHKKPCLFFCNLCCNKCLCVPSGTYGNKEECPCYNNWKTKEGGPKCP
ncbi:gibberellin-regulated protein 12-like [Actinidia eriantha]|uniref:gibberellin-regulated protein 12-like n=1 Tax=Actinidia eriantha TaxID=165200 RepID=UPI00258558C4|nr:gibberellin-regulated protein 12-like [Actinidia eriantha]